jgi:hypothetical protein
VFQIKKKGLLSKWRDKKGNHAIGENEKKMKIKNTNRIGGK